MSGTHVHAFVAVDAGHDVAKLRAEGPVQHARYQLLVRELQRLAGLDQRWAEERTLVDRILELRRQLREDTEAKVAAVALAHA